MNIFLITLVLVLIYGLCNEKKNLEGFIPIYSYVRGKRNRLHTLLSATVKLFEKENIPYSITGRTLHSAITCKKLSKYESVATVVIRHVDLTRLMNLSTEFLQLGLGFNDTPDGNFILSSAISLPSVNGIAIKIIPLTISGENWITVSKPSSLESEQYAIRDLFPTKTYKLDNLLIQGPQDPTDYLNRNFTYRDKVTNVKMIPRFPYYNTRDTIVLGNGQQVLVPHVGRRVTYSYFDRIKNWFR